MRGHIGNAILVWVFCFAVRPDSASSACCSLAEQLRHTLLFVHVTPAYCRRYFSQIATGTKRSLAWADVPEAYLGRGRLCVRVLRAGGL
jgi:hypothetical protein